MMVDGLGVYERREMSWMQLRGHDFCVRLYFLFFSFLRFVIFRPFSLVYSIWMVSDGAY
jgi:hypothetical protein